MSHKAGTILMLLGMLSILVALSLLIYGQQAVAAELMPKLIAQIEENHSGVFPTDATTPDTTMNTVTIDGREYIGYLMIPALGLELSVISD